MQRFKKHRKLAVFVVTFIVIAFVVVFFPKLGNPDPRDLTRTADVPASVQPPETNAVAHHAPVDTELLRLRGEVAILRNTVRQQTNTAASAMVSDAPHNTQVQLSDMGSATPEASIRTILWAANTSNKQRYKDTIVWGDEAVRIARANGTVDTNEIFFTVTNPAGRVESVQIVGVDLQGPDHARAALTTVTRTETSEKRELRHMDLVRINGSWKWLVRTPADVSILPFTPEPQTH